MGSEPPKSDLGFRALLWHWVRRPGWSVAAPVLLIAFAGAFAWQIFFMQSDLDKGLAVLNATYRESRPVEARLSGFSYAIYDGGKVKVDDHSFKLAEGLLLTQTKNVRSFAAIHARGKFYLANNRLDEALQELEAARQLEPNNSQLHNDLGVAWMEKATRERNSPEANKHFDQCRIHLELSRQNDSRNLEALFNLALLDFRQGLWKQAEASWHLYLKNDERSGWAQEAKMYLNRIKTLQEQTTNSNV